MKQLLLYILLFTSTSATAQRYDNITNDWCKMNLKGKVKEMKVDKQIKLWAHTNLTRDIKTTLYFSKKGYLTKTVDSCGGMRTTTYHYTFHKDHTISLVKETSGSTQTVFFDGYHVTPAKPDSIVYIPINNSSFEEVTYSYMRGKEHISTKKYIFNNKRQLIKTINAHYSTNYTYHKDHINVQSTNNKREEEIVSTDILGNTTLSKISFEFAPLSTITKNITYTYYD